MRFRYKIYLCVLALFLLALDASAFALLQKSYNQNKQMDIWRGTIEYETVSETLNHLIDGTAGGKKISDVSLRQLIDSFSQSLPGTSMELYRDGTLFFSNTTYFEGDRPELRSASPMSVYRNINGRLRLYVGSTLVQEGLSLSLSRDANYLTEYYHLLLRYFILLSVSISVLLSLLLLFFLRHLMRPIERLGKAANEIAEGDYSQRVPVKTQDEIGALAESFNKMAEAVSEQIQELTRLNEEKEQFIRNLTHELKTPIAILHGYSEFLQNANCSDAEKSLALHYIQEHTVRLEQLTGRLLELLRLRNEALCPEEIDIQTLFTSVQSLSCSILEKKNVTLQSELQVQTLYGDYILLQTALMNLVENAVKASPDGSEIKLCSRKEDSGTVLEVSDHGCGIPEADLEHICEEFYRVDKSRSRASGGLGLGLSICRLIAQLHGGSLAAESTYGEGAAFRLVLPDVSAQNN